MWVGSNTPVAHHVFAGAQRYASCCQETNVRSTSLLWQNRLHINDVVLEKLCHMKCWRSRGGTSMFLLHTYRCYLFAWQHQRMKWSNTSWAQQLPATQPWFANLLDMPTCWCQDKISCDALASRHRNMTLHTRKHVSWPQLTNGTSAVRRCAKVC
jgi:hypothetical protein